MCTTCGCSSNATPTIDGQALKSMTFSPLPPHDHTLKSVKHEGKSTEILELELNILSKNDAFAKQNRDWLEQKAIFSINLLSSPGAGKTTLLESTVKSLAGEYTCCVVEGDQATENDAARIRASGARALQINTGSGCHLEADMLANALQILEPPENSIVFIENVGNLVCPALFDLGETRKAVILSITEGEDKPIKYPDIFHRADLVLINKIDLLPHLDFDLEKCIGYIKEVNSRATIICLSAKNPADISEWLLWLKEEAAIATRSADPASYSQA